MALSNHAVAFLRGESLFSRSELVASLADTFRLSGSCRSNLVQPWLAILACLVFWEALNRRNHLAQNRLAQKYRECCFLQVGEYQTEYCKQPNVRSGMSRRRSPREHRDHDRQRQMSCSHQVCGAS